MTIQTIESAPIFTIDVGGEARATEPFISEQRIQARVMEMGSMLRERYLDTGRTHVHTLTVLNGAVHFASDLRRAMQRGGPELMVTSDYISLASYDGTESTGALTVNQAFDACKMTGTNVLIIEDILDSGLTLQWLTSHLRMNYSLNSLEIATLLNKNNPNRPAGVLGSTVLHAGFEIPNDFVLGYGLDYFEEYRDLPDIYRLV